jgi:hypothetical protein
MKFPQNGKGPARANDCLDTLIGTNHPSGDYLHRVTFFHSTSRPVSAKAALWTQERNRHSPTKPTHSQSGQEIVCRAYSGQRTQLRNGNGNSILWFEFTLTLGSTTCNGTSIFLVFQESREITLYAECFRYSW